MSGMSVRSWTTRHELGLFFVLAFLLSWALWPLLLLNADSSPLVPFGPLGAALIVSALSGGWRAVGALLSQLGHWRVHPVWYAVALVGSFLLTALAGAVAVAAGAPSPGFGVYSDWWGVVTTLVATAVIIGVFEEVGWRGFALVPYLLAVLAYSVLITWLYNSTRGNLPIVILVHAAINTAAKFLMPEFGGPHEATAWWCYAAVYVLAALAVIAVAGASRLPNDLPRGDRSRPEPMPADKG